MLSLNWTDQGIRAVKDSPKRSEDARELAKKVGVEIKHLYLTSGARQFGGGRFGLAARWLCLAKALDGLLDSVSIPVTEMLHQTTFRNVRVPHAPQ
jgi:hypothetical protein